MMQKYIYTLKNTVNGKVYVGCTQCPQYRLFAHKGNLRRGKHSNKPLQADYDKYGDCFEFEVVSGPWSDREGFKREHELMEAMKTYDERYGYNSTETAVNAIRRNHGLSYRVSPLKGRPIGRGNA